MDAEPTMTLSITLPTRLAVDAAALLAVLTAENSDDFSLPAGLSAIGYLSAIIGGAYKEFLNEPTTVLTSAEQKQISLLCAAFDL